jgi:hypothetical protein
MQVSEAVQQFIVKYITSVDQLEILLLLHEYPEREWNADDVARHLFTESTSAESRLAELAANGLISTKSPGDRMSYRHGPKTPQLERAIAELAKQYPKYRVRIINLIFSKPIDKIRTFADAFRLKQDDEDEEAK